MDFRRIDDFLIDCVAQPASDWLNQMTGFARSSQIKVVIHSLAGLIFFMVIYAWNHRSTWVDNMLVISFFIRLASLFKWLHSLPTDNSQSTAMPPDRLRRYSPRMFELGCLAFFIGSMCICADVLSGCFIANSFLDVTIENLRACRDNPPRKAREAAAAKMPEVWGIG